MEFRVPISMASVHEVLANSIRSSVLRSTTYSVPAPARFFRCEIKRPAAAEKQSPLSSMPRCSYHAIGVAALGRPPGARFTYRDAVQSMTRNFLRVPISRPQKHPYHTCSSPLFAASRSGGQSLRRAALPSAERSGSAPPLSDKEDVNRPPGADSDPLGGREAPGQAEESRQPLKTYRPSSLRATWRAAVRQLASFPLAIGMLFWIAGLCALGESQLPTDAPFTNRMRHALTSAPPVPCSFQGPS